MMRLGRKGAARRELFVAMCRAKGRKRRFHLDRIWYMIAVDRDEDKGPTSCQTCDHNAHPCATVRRGLLQYMTKGVVC
jgi:hypothetical protein